MLIKEIFRSIQGESSYSGLPCSFIRTAGCNLQCSYCDTVYASHGGEDLSLKVIMARIKKLGGNIVEITGGEPLLEEDTPVLAEKLIKEKFTVLVETNGSLDISVLPKEVIRIMDIKCPGSGMSEKMKWGNIQNLTDRDEVKFVISHREDYEWSINKIKEYDLEKRTGVLFSCVFDRIEPKTLAGWILEDGIYVRLQLQLHKYIWGTDKRGV